MRAAEIPKQKPLRLAAPTVRLWSVDEVKAHLRVDHDDEDTLIGSLVLAAEAHLDGFSGVLGRALITQTWAQSWADFADRMPLPLAPVQSVTGVVYRDAANAQQTAAASLYLLQNGLGGPYLARADAAVWPTTYARDDAVTATFVAGYGSAATDVPMAIRHAALLLIGHWFEHREAVGVAAWHEMPLAVRSLLGPYRRVP